MLHPYGVDRTHCVRVRRDRLEGGVTDTHWNELFKN